MSNPFFSVIIPAHNSAEYIRTGLDSIRQQAWTGTPYELIVVCDNCTDNTADVAREYTDKVVEVGYGLDGKARNTGLDMATGDWILFMDDDDHFLHEFVFWQIAEKLAEVDVDVLAFSFIWKGKRYQQQTPWRRNIAVWTKCWRREFIGDTRFSDVPYWSDVDFNRWMFGKNPRVFYWDMPMYYYNYLRPGSISWREKKGEIPGRV